MSFARRWLWSVLVGSCVAGVALARSGQLDLALGTGLVGALIAGLTHWGEARRARRQLGQLTELVERRIRGEEAAAPDDEHAQLWAVVDRASRALETRSSALVGETATVSAVLEAMAEGVWITDSNGLIVRHNAALREIFPAAKEQVGTLEIVRNPEVHHAVLRACTEGERADLEISTDNPRPRQLAVHVAPLQAGLQGSLAVFHDLTELRQLERARQELVANVSHELRTPITAIRGYAETLQGGALEDRTHAPRMIDIIHWQSERLSALVDDLLELSRLEAQQAELAHEPVDLQLSCASAVETLRPLAEQRDIAVELSVPSSLTALADPRAVEHLVQNLIDNAVKYTQPGGRVTVRGVVEEGRCRVDVKDTGVGIAPPDLLRVFERFYRVEKGRGRELGGSGLGLSIVKHLAQAMGGEVRAVSQPGEGSTFSVFLPLAGPKADATFSGG
jgi:two-component system, OmpR family, phosphate regulon sensor histidine kinase PhoR